MIRKVLREITCNTWKKGDWVAVFLKSAADDAYGELYRELDGNDTRWTVMGWPEGCASSELA